MQFPQYRKLTNGKSIYQIVDDRQFNEKQKIGSKVYFYSIKAEQYPEILKIQDMLKCFEDIYCEATEEEWLIFS